MTFSSIVADTQELRVRPERRDVGPHKPDNNGFGLCTQCGRPIHRVVTGTWLVPGDRDPKISYLRHNPIPRLRRVHDNDRAHCSSCSRPFPAYELSPGDGRCKECQP